MTRNLAELDHRESNGIAVSLLWNRTTNQIVVRVTDEREDADFEITCAPAEALTVFHHPYAYVANRPVQNRKRLPA